MSKILTTRNAQITTVAVEIKSLTVSSKQVTQSVFRQLIEEPLIREDGTLAGAPWGHVNYHPDKCGDHFARHMHVVWQRGSELRRARIDLTADFDRSPGEVRGFRPELADDFFAEVVRKHLHEGETGYFTGIPWRQYKNSGGVLQPFEDRTVSLHGVPVTFFMSEKALAAVTAMLKWGNRLRVAEEKNNQYQRDVLAPAAQEAFEVALAELDHERADSPPLAELFALVDQQANAEAERRQRHRDTIATLAALPHLFIAV